MKTTIYKLLGLIKDGKAPERIKCGNNIYTYQEHIADYSVEDDMDLFDGGINTFMLNDEVEILDEPKEDKIEKIDMFDFFTGYWYKELPEDFKKHLENNFETLNEIINKIIDEVNKLKENK